MSALRTILLDSENSVDIKLKREGFRIFVCWVLHYFAESHNWCSILEVEQITRGRIFMAVTW